MRTGRFALLMVVAISAVFLIEIAHSQFVETPKPVNPGLSCHSAPCVLPPTQASEGGGTATDTPIAANPLNAKELLLGSVDYNCSGQGSDLGFHLSADGGSTWNRVLCMPGIVKGGKIWDPDDEPSVVYDAKGTAYATGLYFCTGYCYGSAAGLAAVQKSTDGTHWSKPVVALRHSGQTYPFETALAVDTSVSSPWLNSLYVSGVMWSDQGFKNQILVSHSVDAGTTWNQVAVDRVQSYPDQDRLTRNAVGKDGTVYVTWMRCVGTNTAICLDDIGHIMLSKSIDGGNKWSSPSAIAKVTMPPNWLLPITYERGYNYPVIAADNSDGTYSGSLYVAMYNWTGSYLRVQVIRSTDGGVTWSKPVYLAPKKDTHDQFFPSISVSSTGKVGVSWLDRRNDPKNIDYQAFAAISTDGGKSFGANWQLTKAFSDPRTNGTENNWMGDYTGNTWSGDTFIAAWMDSSNGVDMQEVVGGVRLK
jgi:hypothetical protein